MTASELILTIALCVFMLSPTVFTLYATHKLNQAMDKIKQLTDKNDNTK